MVSCKDESIDRNVPVLEVQMEFSRLDQEIFNPKASLVHEQLIERYPDFYPIFFKDILLLGDPSDSASSSLIDRFRNDDQMLQVQGQIDSVFIDLSDIEEDFEKAFGRYKSIWPENEIPDIIFMNSGFNYAVYPMPDKSEMSISLEFFLGKENSVIKNLPNSVFPAYLREKMNPDQLVPNALKGWLLIENQKAEKAPDLLHLMTTYGKIMYSLHLCIPDIEEHLHYSYSEQELLWCYDNESSIWRTIVTEDILYSSNREVLIDWVGRGPYTQGFSEESPAELAYFMGKQMVKDFMVAHPQMEIDELMETPAAQILKSYNPN